MHTSEVSNIGLTQFFLSVLYPKKLLVEAQDLPGDAGCVVSMTGRDGLRTGVGLHGRITGNQEKMKQQHPPGLYNLRSTVKYILE